MHVTRKSWKETLVRCTENIIHLVVHDQINDVVTAQKQDISGTN